MVMASSCDSSLYVQLDLCSATSADVPRKKHPREGEGGGGGGGGGCTRKEVREGNAVIS